MLEIKQSDVLIDSIIAMDLFTAETKEKARKADILLLPDIGVIEEIEKAFRPDTLSFYKYAINNLQNCSIELLEDAGKENILNFHSLDIYLPIIYLRNKKLLPTVIELVYQYTATKIKHGRNDEPIVNLILKVEEDETCQIYTYKGVLDDLNVSFVQTNIL